MCCDSIEFVDGLSYGLIAESESAHPFTMEDAKLQALHDTLSKLQSGGRRGLGVSRQYSWQKKNGTTTKIDYGLPNNALYANFVPEGALYNNNQQDGLANDGDGRFIKRNFSDDEDQENEDDGSDEENSSSIAKKTLSTQSTTTSQKLSKEERKALKKSQRKAEKLAAKKQAKLEAKRLAKLQAKKQYRDGTDKKNLTEESKVRQCNQNSEKPAVGPQPLCPPTTCRGNPFRIKIGRSHARRKLSFR